MTKYKAGIIGCGRIFPMHAVPIRDQAEVELQAVCDIKKGRAQTAAKEFNCRPYFDYKKMLSEEELDVVHICTPHYHHAPATITAAQQKIDILTEKPMSITEKNAQKMIAAAAENDVTLGVIFQNRYNPGSVLIKEKLSSGELGKIKGARLFLTWQRTDEYYSQSDWKGTWDKEGGGVIIDQSIHTLDLLRWLVDSPVTAVEASIATRNHDYIEVEDMAEGIINFNCGVTASFYTMNYYSCDAPVELELHCERGTAKITGDTGRVSFNNGKIIEAQCNPEETFNYGSGQSYWGVSHVKQINNYYRALLKGEKPDITGNEALKTQQLVCAIYKSGKENKRINF